MNRKFYILLGTLLGLVVCTLVLVKISAPATQESDLREQELEKRRRYLSLAYQSLGRGDFENAERTLNRILAEHISDPKALTLLGIVRYRQGRYPAAVKIFTQLTERGVKDAAMYNNLGQALVKTGKYQEAINAFDQALKLQPDALLIKLNKAAACSVFEKRAEAMALLREIHAKLGGNMLPLLADPLLDNVRSEAEFQDFLAPAVPAGSTVRSGAPATPGSKQ